MKLIHKSLYRDEWTGIKKEVRVLRIAEESFQGTIGLITIRSLDTPIVIKNEKKNICIGDVGYKWLQVAPKNENWWLTVVFDDRDNLIESYFDITRYNDFSDELRPTFIDMCLDVVFGKENDPVILDEDELKEALEENLITNTEYEMALSLAKNIVNCYNRNKAKYYEWIDCFYRKLRD